MIASKRCALSKGVTWWGNLVLSDSTCLHSPPALPPTEKSSKICFRQYCTACCGPWPAVPLCFSHIKTRQQLPVGRVPLRDTLHHANNRLLQGIPCMNMKRTDECLSFTKVFLCLTRSGKSQISRKWLELCEKPGEMVWGEPMSSGVHYLFREGVWERN